MSALAWCLGVGFVAALLLGWSGIHPSENAPRLRRRQFPAPKQLAGRVGLAVLGAIVLGGVTGWPVAAIGGAALGWFALEVLAPKQMREAQIERTEAIAGWAEQLRDTMAGAAGLQEAIVATAPLAPDPIRLAVVRMAARAAREPLGPLLVELADELADPTADLVLTSLVLAASGEGEDLGEVLSALSDAARDEATMRRFVDASRARNRTAVRAITAIALITVVLLLLFARAYLHPYGSVAGQLVLAIVFSCYGVGIALLARMGRERPPERILSAAASRGTNR